MAIQGVHILPDEFWEGLHDDRTEEVRYAEDYASARKTIRLSLEEMNGWPIEHLMLSSEGEYSERESKYADIRINIHSVGVGRELIADYGSYRFRNPEFMRGLVIHISPMASLVFDRKTEDGKHWPFAILERWSGLRGPLVFELLDLD